MIQENLKNSLITDTLYDVRKYNTRFERTVTKFFTVRYIVKALLTTIGVIFIAFTFILPHKHLPKVDTGEGDGSIQVYYINLDKAEERRKAITPQLDELGIPYQRIVAVYGKGLTQEEKDKLVNKTRFKLFMQREVLDGEIGCYLSHLNTWKEFLKSKASYALVFEDDASFNPDELREVVDELIASNDKWDYINLSPFRPVNGRVITKLTQHHELQAPRRRMWCNACYLINRTAAASLIKHALPIRVAVDQYAHRTWELGYKYRVVFPKVVDYNFGNTYIGNGGYSEKWYLRLTNKVFRDLSNFMCFVMAYVR